MVKVGVDRGITFDHATKMVQEKMDKAGLEKPLAGEGFYRSARALIGREKEDFRAYALLLQKPIPAFALNPVPLFKVYRAGTGLGKDVALAEFTDGGRFKKVAPDEAKSNWTLCFTEAEKYCSHGKNCKHGKNCTVGRRIEYKHLLTGAVLPFWNQIQEAVGYKNVATTGGGYRQQSNMQIVRLRVDKTPQQAEQRLVGVLIDDRQLAALQRSIDDGGDDGAAHAAAHGGAGPSSYKGKMPGGAGRGGGAAAAGAAAASASSCGGNGDSTGRPLAVRAVVIIFGLEAASAKQYNYQTARIQRWDDAQGRYQVEIIGGAHKGASLAVKGSKLKRV